MISHGWTRIHTDKIKTNTCRFVFIYVHLRPSVAHFAFDGAKGA